MTDTLESLADVVRRAVLAFLTITHGFLLATGGLTLLSLAITFPAVGIALLATVAFLTVVGPWSAIQDECLCHTQTV
jgi:hypothetical protein